MVGGVGAKGAAGLLPCHCELDESDRSDVEQEDGEVANEWPDINYSNFSKFVLCAPVDIMEKIRLFEAASIGPRREFGLVERTTGIRYEPRGVRFDHDFANLLSPSDVDTKDVMHVHEGHQIMYR